MRSSQALMLAMGELDDTLIEEAGIALGYYGWKKRSAQGRTRARRAFLLAAILTLLLALGVTAYAANLWGIRAMFQSATVELPEAADTMIETHSETEEGTGWRATVTEALCDAGNILVTITVQSEDYILAPTDASPTDPLWRIGREGEGTIGDYAKAQGKRLLFVGAALHGDESLGLGRAGQQFVFQAEGEMAILILASKTVSAPRFDAVCTVYALADGTQEVERAEIPLVLTEGASQPVGVFVPLSPETIPGITLGDLSVTESPLGYDLQWEVRAEDAEAYGAIMKVTFDEIRDYLGGGSIPLGENRYLGQMTMARGEIGDTLTARFYDWDKQEIGSVVFRKK